MWRSELISRNQHLKLDFSTLLQASPARHGHKGTVEGENAEPNSRSWNTSSIETSPQANILHSAILPFFLAPKKRNSLWQVVRSNTSAILRTDPFAFVSPFSGQAAEGSACSADFDHACKSGPCSASWSGAPVDATTGGTNLESLFCAWGRTKTLRLFQTSGGLKTIKASGGLK